MPDGLGQVYKQENYEGRISSRTKRIGGKSFTEKTLPISSVREYFEHFQVLEIDYTFYSPLLDRKGAPTRILHVLRQYRAHMKEHARVIVKVPRITSARKMWRRVNTW